MLQFVQIPSNRSKEQKGCMPRRFRFYGLCLMLLALWFINNLPTQAPEMSLLAGFTGVILFFSGLAILFRKEQ